MALTDEQYQQIFRYVDEEIDADEVKAFEAALIENRELFDELEFYKQVRLLGDAVEQKARGKDRLRDEEKKISHEQTSAMLARARKKWENTYEDELKLKYGITEAICILTTDPDKETAELVTLFYDTGSPDNRSGRPQTMRK